MFSLSTTGTFNDCTFNISGTTYTYNMCCTFNRCHIHFNNFISSSNGLFRNDENISNSKVIWNNTYITGSIKSTYGSEIWIFFGGDDMTFNNSYVAVKIDCTYTVSPMFYGSTTILSTSFIDKTLIPAIRNQGYFYYLTTEQCKNNTYLQSIGFQAFPDESV